MTYKFKYKRFFFYKTIKNVKGHAFDLDSDRMDIFTIDGIISIGNWSKYDMKLGSDFLLVQKNDMEQESGTSVTVSGVK